MAAEGNILLPPSAIITRINPSSWDIYFLIYYSWVLSTHLAFFASDSFVLCHASFSAIFFCWKNISPPSAIMVSMNLSAWYITANMSSLNYVNSAALFPSNSLIVLCQTSLRGLFGKNSPSHLLSAITATVVIFPYKHLYTYIREYLNLLSHWRPARVLIAPQIFPPRRIFDIGDEYSSSLVASHRSHRLQFWYNV